MKDDATPLPGHPRLRKNVTVAFVADGSVLVRGQGGAVSLSGLFVSDALPRLLPCLDGKTSLDALTSTVDAAFQPECREFLRVMQARGFLADGPEPDGGSAGRGAFWAQDAPGGDMAAAARARANLAAARIVVAGQGAVGRALHQALTDGGVGHCTHLPRTALTDAPADDAATRGASLIILASDGMSLAGVDAINDLTQRTRTPWLLLRIDRSNALIGPYVVPGETACFTCYELRARANAERPDEHQALFHSWRAASDASADFPTPPEYGQIVGNWVALDVMRAIAGGRAPVTAGRIIVLDLKTLGSTTRDILRLPRCPACSRQNALPLTRIWDLPKAARTARQAV
jgi:bacteriocin biosynthesis cyclodehydratase domain-containing protein